MACLESGRLKESCMNSLQIDPDCKMVDVLCMQRKDQNRAEFGLKKMIDQDRL